MIVAVSTPAGSRPPRSDTQFLDILNRSGYTKPKPKPKPKPIAFGRSGLYAIVVGNASVAHPGFPRPSRPWKMMSSLLRSFTLVRSLRVSTSGLAGVNGVYDFVDLPVSADLMSAIFHAEWVAVVGVLTEGPPNNELEVGLVLVPGTTREQELGGQALMSDVSTSGPPFRAAPYTTVANFLPHSRLRVRMKNKLDVTGVRTGVVSLWLLVKAFG